MADNNVDPDKVNDEEKAKDDSVNESEPKPDTVENPANDDASDDVVDGDAKLTDWQAKYEEMREHARLWEERAKGNKDAADKLDTIEADKSAEIDRLNGLLDAMTNERDEALRGSVRSSVALEFGLTREDADLFLVGSDEETMRRQAEELSKRISRRLPEDHTQGAAGERSVKASAAQWAESLLKK